MLPFAGTKASHADRTKFDAKVALAVAALVLCLVAVGPNPKLLGPVFGLTLCFLAFRRVLLGWRGLLVTLCLVIMLVPARRYALPIDLPYRLEPYRLVVIVILVGVIASALVDPEFRLRRLGFGGVIAGLLATSLLSVAANTPTIARDNLADKVVGSFFQLLTVAAVFVLVRLLATSRRDLNLVFSVLVVCGAFVAAASVVEQQAQVNIFRSFEAFSPFQEIAEDNEGAIRGESFRAVGSSQHPISLGAEMVLLLPIAVYLARHADWPRRARSRSAFWVGAAALLIVGMVASVSRTTVVMLACLLIGGLCLRRRVVKAALPLAVPLLVMLTVVTPSAVGDLIDSLSPEGGLANEQRVSEGTRHSGRLADVGPSLEAMADRPLFGAGFGTRVTEDEELDNLILDNAYLTRGVDTGIPGLIALLALMLAPVRRMWRMARDEAGTADPRSSDMAAALACSFLAYAVSLFFYDGFAFFQPLLTFMIFLAAAGWLLLDSPPWWQSAPPGFVPVRVLVNRNHPGFDTDGGPPALARGRS